MITWSGSAQPNRAHTAPQPHKPRWKQHSFHKTFMPCHLQCPSCHSESNDPIWMLKYTVKFWKKIVFKGIQHIHSCTIVQDNFKIWSAHKYVKICWPCTICIIACTPLHDHILLYHSLSKIMQWVTSAVNKCLVTNPIFFAALCDSTESLSLSMSLGASNFMLTRSFPYWLDNAAVWLSNILSVRVISVFCDGTNMWRQKIQQFCCDMCFHLVSPSGCCWYLDPNWWSLLLDVDDNNLWVTCIVWRHTQWTVSSNKLNNACT